VDFSALEADRALGCREKRVVPAHADVAAGEELGPALPEDYRSGFGLLAAKQLHASVLWVAVPAVSG